MIHLMEYAQLVTLHIDSVVFKRRTDVRTDGEAIHAREAPRPESMPCPRRDEERQAERAITADGSAPLVIGTGEREMPT